MNSNFFPSGRSSRLIAPLVDLLFPPSCPNCGEMVDQAASLCGACWAKITFLADPLCSCCGLPFEYDLGDEVFCGGCIKKSPAFNRARAVMTYDEHSRHMVLGFKHADKTELARMFAHWMARAGSELVTDCDLILPVPLHRFRLIKRRFNQSALLARMIADICGKPAHMLLLRRHKATVSQGGLNAAGRRKNMAGAFNIPDRKKALIKNKKILLVDDVLTTGATVSACTRSLLKAGACQVDVITLCRVVRASSVAI